MYELNVAVNGGAAYISGTPRLPVFALALAPGSDRPGSGRPACSIGTDLQTGWEQVGQIT
jgi:hypothetical protein